MELKVTSEVRETHRVRSSCSSLSRTCSSSWRPERRSCCRSPRRCWRRVGSCRHTGHSSGEEKTLECKQASVCYNLGAVLPVSLAVCLGQLGAVAVLVHTGLGGGQGGAGRARHLQNSHYLLDTSKAGGHLLTLHGGDGPANAAHAHALLETDVAALSPVCYPESLEIMITDTERSESLTRSS